MSASVDTLPRVFIACAPQDQKYAELITTKAQGDRLPLVFDGMGEGRIDEVGWQLECRRRIRGSRAMVVLMSLHTNESARAKWQVQCAREHGLPVVGITVIFDDEPGRALGADVEPESIVGWKWKTVAATLMRFAAAPAPTPTARGKVARSSRLAPRGSAA